MQANTYKISAFREGQEKPSCPVFIFGAVDGITNVASARRSIPGVNLIKVLCVGPWNVLNISQDHLSSHLSDELSSLRVNMMELSKTRRPGRGR